MYVKRPQEANLEVECGPVLTEGWERGETAKGPGVSLGG